MRIQLIIISVLLLISCNNKWSESAKKEFLGGCLAFASNENMDEEKRVEYCYCLLEKYEAEFKEENWKKASFDFVETADSSCLSKLGYDMEKKGVSIDGGY